MGSRLEANSESVRKRIAKHTFDDEDGDEYEGSKFGGFSDYFRRKKIKLQNLDADLRSQSSNKPQIFKGVTAYVNGYTQPSLNDLHTLIVQHGGGFMQYLNGKTTVTHIIAGSLTPKKVEELRRYRVVKPAWVVDSIDAGRLLPWNDYRVIDQGGRQKVLASDRGRVPGNVNDTRRGYRDQSYASWYTSQLKDTQANDFPSSPPLPRRRLLTPEPLEDGLPPSHQPELPDEEDSSWMRQLEDIAGPSNKLVATPRLISQRQSHDAIVEDTVPADNWDLYADPVDEPQQHKIAEPVLDRERPESPQPKNNKPLTAEEHNAILLRDPKIRKCTVVDPNFLDQYYRESRLHHLSTWKADLKSQLQALANEASSSQKAKQKRRPGARRYVLHADFDSFFAAVSLKKNPQYKDEPAVVAHGNGSGSEIASCNYPARKFGIKNGMWMKRAQELCPNLKILPYDFPAYEETSRTFYDVILGTGGIVQSLSVDEALIDVSNLCVSSGGSDGRQVPEGSIYHEQAKADEIALSLRQEIKKKTDCHVSVGIGGNILLAKVALRKAKPAGQYHIKPNEVLEFVGQLQVQDLPGVAGSIGGKLEEVGVRFVKDMREITKERLIQALGPKTGEKLWEYSRGIDKQEVGEQVIRKSISAEVNWGVRFENQIQADEFVGSLCGELQKRLLKEKVKGKQFTMKVMRRSPDAPLDPPKHLGHGKCDIYNKSLMLGVPTNSKEVLTKEALSILRGFRITPGELRGFGIQMTKLEPIKATADGILEGSQRRLQFKVGNAASKPSSKVPQAIESDPIQDDPITPRKPKAAKEDEHVAFGPPELNHSTPSRRPLNMMGTQFLLPTQVDPKVLEELPEDIRSKLARQRRRSQSPTPVTLKTPKTLKMAEEASPSKLPFALTALPAQSQLDPEILAALPPDVRAEVLSQYAAGTIPQLPSHHSKHISQTILPQSPPRNKIVGIIANKAPAPRAPRGRGRPPKSAQLAAAALSTARDKSGRTLHQTNFISARSFTNNNTVDLADDPDIADLDQNFLAALPSDLRDEVIQTHKRTKQQELLDLALKKPPPHEPLPPIPCPPQKVIVLRPPPPTFTTQKLSDKSALRAAVKEWIKAFSEEGPYTEDVDALAGYLAKVVCEERDLNKAVAVAKWFEWVVDEGADLSEEFAVGAWEDAVERVKDGIRGAARERGMGKVVFQ